jgi:hypothetical protein
VWTAARPELRADGRHQAGPQAPIPVRSTLPGRDHQVTAASASVAGTIAVTVMWTPPRQARPRQPGTAADGGLQNIIHTGRLPPGSDRGAGTGAGNPAGQAAAGRGDGLGDQRKASTLIQDRGQLTGSLLLAPGPVSMRYPAGPGHQDTSLPVSQPAFSSAARMPSAVRWP